MPIKLENRARYPAHWREIRQQVLRRAMHRCEWPGCSVANHAWGYWPAGRIAGFVTVTAPPQPAPDARMKLQLALQGCKVIRIVLTIAHLDHTPEHCELQNLCAWCQRHHLAYDQDHHKQTAYMTRRARANTQELPL